MIKSGGKMELKVMLKDNRSYTKEIFFEELADEIEFLEELMSKARIGKSQAVVTLNGMVVSLISH